MQMLLLLQHRLEESTDLVQQDLFASYILFFPSGLKNYKHYSQSTEKKK
jgi:hypothetical protein